MSSKSIFMSQLYSIKLQEFDLIVIETGSGLDVANAAYQHGLRVAVIEKDRVGGTCLNNGSHTIQAIDS